MFMLHTAVFPYSQAFASRLQLFFAGVMLFTGLQALGGSGVGSSHGTVAEGIFFHILGIVRYGMGSKQC